MKNAPFSFTNWLQMTEERNGMHKYKKGNIRNNVFTIFIPDQTKGVFKEEFDERLSSKLGEQEDVYSTVVIFCFVEFEYSNVPNGYI